VQRRLIEDVAFRVLAAGNEPDFRTIADFRKKCQAPARSHAGHPYDHRRRVATDLLGAQRDKI
jgi:transposase